MFSRWLRKRKEPAPALPPIAPEHDFIAVGDIHGQFHLLERLLKAEPDLPIVFVGDYVDRGDQSAQVLAALKSRPDDICLMGNHEEMMLNFLDKPEESGPRWLRNGGLQTMASFGVAGLSDATHGRGLITARDRLAEAMGADMIDWLSQLPTQYTTGNVAVVHAGADPQLPMAEQSRSTLLWGHPEFGRRPRQDGMWVVHGHTIVDEARSEGGVVSIDTGAYATGRLTAAYVRAGEVDLRTL
jgi:serine/threonine protein phosphatase 1